MKLLVWWLIRIPLSRSRCEKGHELWITAPPAPEETADQRSAGDFYFHEPKNLNKNDLNCNVWGHFSFFSISSRLFIYLHQNRITWGRSNAVPGALSLQRCSNNNKNKSQVMTALYARTQRRVRFKYPRRGMCGFESQEKQNLNSTPKKKIPQVQSISSLHTVRAFPLL